MYAVTVYEKEGNESIVLLGREKGGWLRIVFAIRGDDIQPHGFDYLGFCWSPSLYLSVCTEQGARQDEVNTRQPPVENLLYT